MLHIGDIALERYRLLSVLGEGGMGRVFLAEHVRLGTRVALKVLLRHDGQDLDRFRAEAQLMARVAHPNTVSLLDYGESVDGSPILAMEFIQGVSLGDMLDSQRALEWSFVAHVVSQALDGLDAAHEIGIIHRDIKPSNILLSAATPPQVKLADFGIAKEASGTKLTKTGLIVGTPDYMAPEVLAGKPATPTSDVYSMGCTLFETVAGLMPFEGEEALARFERAAPPLVAPDWRTAVPDAFAEVVATALQRRPPDRFPSAEAMAHALRLVLRGKRPSPRTPQDQIGSDQVPGGRTPGATVRKRRRATSSTDGPVAEPPAAVPARGLATGWVFVASLPASRLALAEERRYLASLVGEHGRGYSMGRIIWFAVFEGPEPERHVAAIRAAMAQRYGGLMRALASEIPADFRLSTKQLAGAAPLPAPLPDLIERVTS